MAETVVEIRDVSKNALKAVSIEVEKGDFLVIFAPSGSGKTTLLNLISCMEPLESGQISVDGIDISTIENTDVWRASNIGYVYEEGNLVPTLTVYENVELPLTAAGVGRSERRERVLEALKTVGLSDKVRLRSSNLGIEEEQRVALARAIAAQPVVILADEPTGRLRKDAKERLVGLMADLNRNAGHTFVVATHDPRIRAVGTEVVELPA